MASRVKIQEIAVFGESGSGKTVLLSSFYGATQEPGFGAESSYLLIADDTSQRAKLRQNYLRMRNEAHAPVQTRFAAEPYSFTIKPKEAVSGPPARSRAVSALRLIWHDYPGEWFSDEPSNDEEATRRVETFKKLLQADVAVVLVDGQKLIEYSGEEARYLKSLFWSIREGLEHLKEGILPDGRPLKQFPRVWVIALSKADLHPKLEVQAFEDLVIQAAAGEAAALRETLQGFVQIPEALSLGDDFMLLSSAKFEPGKIEVTKRVGLDLLLPVATLLPLERVAQWAQVFGRPLKQIGGLVNRADEFAQMLTVTVVPVIARLVARVPRIGPVIAPVVAPTLDFALRLGTEKLQELHAQALARHDFLTATVVQFRLDLDRGVLEHVLKKRPW